MKSMHPFLQFSALSLLAGLFLSLAFAPFSLFPCALFALALLLFIWHAQKAKNAFFFGCLFGISFFSTSVYWIFISMHRYGDLSIFFAFLLTILFILTLSLFPAVVGFTFKRYFKGNIYHLLFVFPALWVLFEYLRSTLFTGFPWVLLGESAIGTPLLGYAPLLGIYGVSYVVALLSAILFVCLQKLKCGQYKKSLFSFALILIILLAGSFFSKINWTKKEGTPITIHLIQGNIAQTLKWSTDYVEKTLTQYVKLSAPFWHENNIIIWPETAIPIPLDQAYDFLTALNKKAAQSKTILITGIPIKTKNRLHYYNGIISLGYSKREYYLKHHLVPFGEYIPFQHYLNHLLDLLHVPMSDFIRATSPLKPMEFDQLKIATFICYEIAYPSLVLQYQNNFNVLLTLSNDAWFGHSRAQSEHLSIGQMRAVETGRPLLFVANNGLTALINEKGLIIKKAPPYKAVAFSIIVQPMTGKTPWQRYQFYPLFLFIFICLVIGRYYK